MNRLARGWLLTKQSWAIVRGDRTLLVFPIVAGVSGLCVAAVFVGGGVGLRAATGSEPLMIVAFVIGAYLLTLVATFCNVALTACASRALDGEDTTVSEGFAAARKRLGVIVEWSGVQFVVSGLMMVLEAVLREGAGQIVAVLVRGLANLAWAVASFFVIPVIALEGLGPVEALKRSFSIIKQRWGEGVTGAAAIGGLVFLFVLLPAAALIAVGVAVVSKTAVVGGLLIAVGVVVAIVGVVIQSAVATTFKVALYRFATEDRVLGGFEREPLETAFRPRRRRGGGLARTN
jgi:hypothetical protein